MQKQNMGNWREGVTEDLLAAFLPRFATATRCVSRWEEYNQKYREVDCGGVTSRICWRRNAAALSRFASASSRVSRSVTTLQQVDLPQVIQRVVTQQGIHTFALDFGQS
jgi:hypothetical protein